MLRRRGNFFTKSCWICCNLLQPVETLPGLTCPSECCFSFPECVAKGSRLTLEVWRFELCSPSVARAAATVRNRRQPFANDRSEAAKPHRWVALTKCDKIISWRSISSQIAWFSCVLLHGLRLRLRFAWQAQYFRNVSQLACMFFVAGAALCAAASSIFLAGSIW